jgi:hypothetical protein|tara:strand:+ start:577 stop:687 length:111 start_codon:yes stop_codon:yes gene_type:complete
MTNHCADGESQTNNKQQEYIGAIHGLDSFQVGDEEA